MLFWLLVIYDLHKDLRVVIYYLDRDLNILKIPDLPPLFPFCPCRQSSEVSLWFALGLGMLDKLLCMALN